VKRSILHAAGALVAMLFATANVALVRAEPPGEAIFPELRSSLEPIVPLEQGWADPPRAARTRCWWWWLNGNVTAEAITRDLEEMKAKGFGGANIIDAGGATQGGHDQVPHGPDFGSPEWRKLFLHALAEADRLGLELGFNILSGWNLGGPTVTPEQASKKLTWITTQVDGGEKGAAVDVQLEHPPAVADYYRDVTVVAFPDEGEATAWIENFKPKAYHHYPGGNNAIDANWLLNIGGGKAGEKAVDPQSVRNITEAVDADGRLRWQAPPGKWRVLRLGYTLSNSKVSTSSEGWNGWAIDYLDRGAFDQYWREVVDPLLDEAEPYLGKSLRYLHTDSWELGPVNWTPRLPEEFATLRGYEMESMLPALVGYVVGDRQRSNQFLADYRRTLAELIAENNYGAFAEYAHERGLGIHPESGGPHAAPIDALRCLGKSDVMMGEFWAQSPHRQTDDSRFFTKQPASAAHLYGRRTVLAEAFTTIGPQWGGRSAHAEAGVRSGGVRGSEPDDAPHVRLLAAGNGGAGAGLLRRVAHQSEHDLVASGGAVLRVSESLPFPAAARRAGERRSLFLWRERAELCAVEGARPRAGVAGVRLRRDERRGAHRADAGCGGTDHAA
jgi:hypothetical protein